MSMVDSDRDEYDFKYDFYWLLKIVNVTKPEIVFPPIVNSNRYIRFPDYNLTFELTSHSAARNLLPGTESETELV